MWFKKENPEKQNYIIYATVPERAQESRSTTIESNPKGLFKGAFFFGVKMKFISLITFLWSVSIYSQTPITLDKVKEIILQNAENLSNYKEGSVFKGYGIGNQETEDGKICSYEFSITHTILLVPNDEGGKIFVLSEGSQKPIPGDICGDLIKPETNKVVLLISPPVPTLTWLKNLDKEEDKFYQTEEGEIFSEGKDGGKTFYNFKRPFWFMQTRYEDKNGTALDNATQLPDANLEDVYNEIKDMLVYLNYPSGPNSYGGMELKKFGEILKEWKESSQEQN